MSKPRLEVALQAELDRTRRIPELRLEEKQLIDAARDRLFRWKTPSREGKAMKADEEATSVNGPDPETTKAPRKRAPAKKTAKKTAKRAVKKAAKKAKTNSGSTVSVQRIPADAKILKGSNPNPFKEGSGSWERTEKVLKNIGKTREQIEKLTDMLNTTIPNLLKAGVIKIG